MSSYSIGEAARRTGVSITALRFYEAAGVLRSVSRLGNGHRRYSDLDLAWVEFIACLRDSGMSIADIGAYVDLAERPRTESQRHAMLEEHQRRLRRRIEELQRLELRISEKVRWYEAEVASLTAAREDS